MTDTSGGEEAAGVRDPFRGWTIFTVFAAVGTAVTLSIVPERGPIWTAVAAAVCLIVEALYLIAARPALVNTHENTPRAWLWAAAAFVLFPIALWGNQWSSLLLFAISPAVFLAFRIRLAIPIIIAFDLEPLALGLIKYPLTLHQVVWEAGTAAVTVAVSIFFSGRIQSVMRESEERRRLIVALREGQAQVAALSAAQGASVERARIAREMHDTLAQGFASIVALSNATRAELDTDPDSARRHLELITATASENLGESRRIIAALTPGRLAGASLNEAIARTVDAFSAESSVAAVFEVDGETQPLPASVDVVLLRVAQEALTNVRRHAHATHASVRLAFGRDHVELEIIDDGDGFDPGRAGDAGRFGLAGMTDRVADVGGSFDVEARPGDGTRIRVRIPNQATMGGAA